MDGSDHDYPGARTIAGFEPPGSPPGGPDPTTVHALHDRYLIEVVEKLNLCPFARRSREQGGVHRPLFATTDQAPTPAQGAAGLVRVLEDHPQAEIVLLTFVHAADHGWRDPAPFDEFVRSVRDSWESLSHPTRFYMVGFHPRPAVESERVVTADSLVPLIRRTPDPVIQCVRAQVLDQVRAQAQAQAQARLEREVKAMAPEIQALLKGSVQTDPELSSDIARHNFEAAGEGKGRDTFEAVIAELRAERLRTYGR